MTDYRKVDNREELFRATYRGNLTHGILPGLVYRYLPQLADKFNWDNEQKLWFTYLNGNTQNPITSLVLMAKQPRPFLDKHDHAKFKEWFDQNWHGLSFDTDRRYSKKLCPDSLLDISSNWDKAIALYTDQTDFDDLWEFANSRVSFGRLSTFSHLEYAYIYGLGPDCNRMFYSDKSGSKSHRNGTFFLLGKDDYVWDKRQPNSHDGNYDDFGKICSWLEGWATGWLTHYSNDNPDLNHVSRFTFESTLCQFKNGFFGRRYYGVYADMAHNRILKAEADGVDKRITDLFRELYNTLPEGLREPLKAPIDIKARAALLPETGTPYRAEHYL